MRISIIIPCYNPDITLLKRTIESIIKQEFNDYELILIDDGSNNHNDIAKLCSLDSRIRIIKQENNGVSSARNLGIRNALGEYLTFVDADDCISPYFFENAISIISDCDFLIGGVFRGNVIPTFNKNDRLLIEYYDREEIKQHILGSDDLIVFDDGGYIGRGPWARLVKASLARQVQFDQTLPIYEDLLWNLKVLNKAQRIGVVKDIWYFYYNNPKSVINSYNPNIISIYENALNKIKKELTFPKDEKIFGNLLMESLFNIYYYKFYYEGNDKNAEIHIYNNEPWIFLKKSSYSHKVKGRKRIRVLEYIIKRYYSILRIKVSIRSIRPSFVIKRLLRT